MNSWNKCPGCGGDNAGGAGVCQWCGANLSHGAATQSQSLRPGAGGADEIALDFPFAPFKSGVGVLGSTLRLYREQFPLVGKVVLAATLPQFLLGYMLMLNPGSSLLAPLLLTTLGSLAFSSLLAGALVYGVVALLRTGASPPLAECYAWALKKWWRVLLCQLLSGVIVGVGFLFLIVPGLFMLTILAVAIPALVVEDLGPVAALERSGHLTENYRVRVFGAVFLLSVATVVVSWLTGVYDAGALAAGDDSSTVLLLLQTFAGQMLNSAHTVLSLFIYLGIRADRGETPALVAAAAPQLP